MEAGSNKLEVLQSMGDWLDSITEGVGEVWERNNAGFNMVDKMRWSRYRDHESAASSILFKYRRQLQSKYGDSIGDVTKCFTEFKTKPFVYPLIKKNQWGPLVAFKVFKMPPEYFDKYRITCKSAGMWWDGIEKCWFVPSRSLHGFDFKSLMIAITDIGFEFMPFERGEIEQAIVVAAPKKDMTLSEAVEAHSRGYLRDAVIIRHRPDSKFEILFPYSPALNDLFSNKSGKLSGITEFNENSKGRETYQIELVLEAIEKIKVIVPNWKLMLSGVDEAKAAWDKRKSELEQQIPEVQSIIAPGFMLYPHQNEGVKAFLKNNGCFLLGDEVGVGKSLQSLSFVAGYGHRALVVAPKVVRRQWIDEAKKFFPNYFNEFNSLELTTKTFKKYEDLSGMSIVSVNYESLEKWWPRIKAAGFDTILIDESHKIKSEKTKTAKMMTGVSPYFKNRILMSGTMIKNKRDELFTQVNIVAPGLFADKEEIRKMSIGAVWNKMQGIYLARRKIDVLKDLPELTTQIALIEHKGIPDFDLNFGISFEEISAFKAVVAKAKAPVSVEFIRDLLDNSESSIIVFTDSVDAAKEIHSELGDDAVLHHGQMSDDSREIVKKDWQSLKIKSRVFVTTRQSLPAGATLTRADKVIFNDLPWTAADIIQATARAHRIGTKNAVNAYWVTVQGNNWDEKLTNIAKRKYDICKKVNEGKQVTAEERAWMNNPVGVQDLLKEVINKKESF